MGSVWQRKGRKGWVLDFQKDGRRVRILANVDTEHEAHLKLDEYLKSTAPLPQDAKEARITLSAYARQWFTRMEGQLEAKTLQSYRQLFDLHIQPVVGSCVVRELRRKRIKELLDRKRQDGMSKNTLRLIRATLSTILSDAVDDELLSVNPTFSLFRKKRGTNQALPDVNPMTWDQVLLFEQALDRLLKEGRIQFHDVVLFHLLRKAGLRPSEAMALQPWGCGSPSKKTCHRLQWRDKSDENRRASDRGPEPWLSGHAGILSQHIADRGHCRRERGSALAFSWRPGKAG